MESNLNLKVPIDGHLKSGLNIYTMNEFVKIIMFCSSFTSMCGHRPAKISTAVVVLGASDHLLHSHHGGECSSSHMKAHTHAIPLTHAIPHSRETVNGLDTLQRKLNALAGDATKYQALIKKADQTYCGIRFMYKKQFNQNLNNTTNVSCVSQPPQEIFRFYLAIHEWDAVSSNQKKKKRAMAIKIIKTFVEVGSVYDNGCLCSVCRNKMLERKHVDEAIFFDDARKQLINDIRMNKELLDIIDLQSH